MKYIKLKEVCMINMGQSPDSSSYNEKKRGFHFIREMQILEKNIRLREYGVILR